MVEGYLPQHPCSFLDETAIHIFTPFETDENIDMNIIIHSRSPKLPQTGTLTMVN